MSQEKRKKQQQIAKKQNHRGAVKNPVALTAKPLSQNQYIALFIVVLISFIAYIPALHNGFVTWDDNAYIQDNLLIRSLNLSQLFSHYVMGNYHPLTMLSYAIEYHFWGLNVTGYHTTNVLLHLFNTILVFYAVLLLSERVEIGLVASLLFGIHPIHVESVAWVSERKDLLYAFFFLASYVCYLYYLRSRQKKFYSFALLLFLLSLLSKAMAASLPVLMLLTDYFKEGKITRRRLVEKTPFLLFSLIFGILAVSAQKASASIQDSSIYTFPQHIAFACYGFIHYFEKLLMPVNLCAFYPYPLKSGMNSEGSIPFSYYIYPFILLVFIAGVLYTLRFTRKVFFGIGFFAITVFLVIQLFPVGDAIMADRYSYIPSIGIFYLAGEGFYLLWVKQQKVIAIALVSVYAIFFFIKTYAQCGTWKDGLAIWDNVINQYQTVHEAYNNRGVTLKNLNRNDEALSDYDKAIQLRSNYFEAHNNKAILLTSLKRYDEALTDASQAIQLKPGDAEAYYNRGIILENLARHEEALNDYNKALILDPNYVNVYNNRANILMNEKRYEEALNDFNKAIELDPHSPNPYLNEGTLFTYQNKYDDAINYYTKAIEIDHNFGQAYYNRGVIENTLGKKDAACSDLQQAILLKYLPAENAFNQFCH